MSAGYKSQAEAWRKVLVELHRIYGTRMAVMGFSGIDCAIAAIRDLEKRASAVDKILKSLEDTRESLNKFNAQPTALAPDPETACAMWIKPTTTVAESDAFLAGARAMLAAAPAAPARGEK